MVDIKVSKTNHDLNEREQKILEVLFINLAAHANAQVTGVNMMFNPLDKSVDEVIFIFQFAWQSALTSTQFEDLRTAIENKFNTALIMCNILNANIEFVENSYLTNNRS